MVFSIPLFSQNSEKAKVLFFNKIGQREIVKIGEKINLIINQDIKPEYSYFAYKSGKNNDEYYIELRSNENYLREIYSLKNSNDSLKKYNKKILEANQGNESNQSKKLPADLQTADIQNLDSLKNISRSYVADPKAKELYRNYEFSVFDYKRTKNKSDSLKKAISGIDSKILKNESTISRNNKKIDTLKSAIDDIKRSGKDLFKIDDYLREIDSLNRANDVLISENKGLNENKLTLVQKLNHEISIQEIYKEIIIFLSTIVVLIIILTFVLLRNYLQKKKFSKVLSDINLKLESSNKDLNNSNQQLKEHNTKIEEQNVQLTELNNEKDKLIQIIRKDLTKASKYVFSLIPKPYKDVNISAEWLFIPSVDLSGDTFGYNWIDENNFAVYLLDVSGHGTGAALHSVQVLNILNNKTLPNVDFRKPDQVMQSLNKIFQMEDHNYIYFTLFYCVYNKNTRKMAYASAGHPPVIMIDSSRKSTYLESQNIFIGADIDSKFKFDELTINNNTSLYIFSDGVYEYSDKNNKMLKFKDFEKVLIDNLEIKSNKLDSIYEFAKKTSGQHSLDDDFTIIKVKFN
jgi:serine phosphatase RsbU (regulator of sigma subunit)